MTFNRLKSWDVPFFMVGSLHSYTNLGLAVTSVNVGNPKIKTLSVSTFYSDGDIDQTDSVRSQRRYENRKITITCEFVENPDKWIDMINSLSDINGRYYTDIFISPYGRHYEGRVSLNPFKTNADSMTVAIDIDAKPYCYYQVSARTYEYTFASGVKTAEIDISTLTSANGDEVYIRSEDDRYIQCDSIGLVSEQLYYGKHVKRIGTKNGDLSTIRIRTTSNNAAYLSRTFKFTVYVCRRANGW